MWSASSSLFLSATVSEPSPIDGLGLLPVLFLRKFPNRSGVVCLLTVYTQNHRWRAYVVSRQEQQVRNLSWYLSRQRSRRSLDYLLQRKPSFASLIGYVTHMKTF